MKKVIHNTVKGFYAFKQLDLGLEIELQLRPYSGYIGIDNSSLDKNFKSVQIL